MVELETMIQKATEIAHRQGFISFDQINDICLKDFEPEQIELVFTALRDAGVDVRDEATPSSALICSFCGKPHTKVVQLIAGASGFICNECIQLCVQVIARDHPDWLTDHIAFVHRLAAQSPGNDPRKG